VWIAKTYISGFGKPFVAEDYADHTFNINGGVKAKPGHISDLQASFLLDMRDVIQPVGA
jgi:hypothetical protein